MKRKHWKVKFGIGLIVLSAALFGLHYLIFHDSHYIFSYLLNHVAFVPIEVLLATLIIHKLLAMHEKQAMLDKLNMAIGVFFSEIGTELLKTFQEFDLDRGMAERDLVIHNDWTPEKFSGLVRKYSGHKMSVDCLAGDMASLKGFLEAKRGFLLGLLANPNLLEHDDFTDLLWAVFHLTEELSKREKVTGLAETDCAHLAGDIKRAYGRLVVNWLNYMMHMKDNYPYLFSLAVRTNPFDKDAKVAVTA